MVTIAKMHGKGGYVILEGVGAVGQLHGWSFSFSRDVVDTSTQGNEYHDSIRGQGAWSGALSAYYDGSNAGKFYDIVNSTTSKDMYLYPDKVDMTRYFYGDAWADFDFSDPVDGAVDIAVTITGTEPLFKSPAL